MHCIACILHAFLHVLLVLLVFYGLFMETRKQSHPSFFGFYGVFVEIRRANFFRFFDFLDMPTYIWAFVRRFLKFFGHWKCECSIRPKAHEDEKQKDPEGSVTGLGLH